MMADVQNSHGWGNTSRGRSVIFTGKWALVSFLVFLFFLFFSRMGAGSVRRRPIADGAICCNIASSQSQARGAHGNDTVGVRRAL
jgi:xanthine/uracil permease